MFRTTASRASRLPRMAAGILALWLVLAPLGAHEPDADADAPHVVAGLGRLHFPTSTRVPAAQSAFERGMLLLHLFEYPLARAAFVQAEHLDPDFAMAYWGEAMTANHPVWNQQDRNDALATLARLGATPAARAAKAPTARERAWLASLDVLYGEGTKPDRDRRYADAMAAMAKAYPQDDEAQLFYALALLGRSEGQRDVPTYLQAAAIAEAAFHRNPQHPGAAHYWIHGMDDPEHAAGALEAARALSQIAPDAGHAQHMTSHIFIALGQWDDLVAANETAQRVVDRQAREEGRPVVDCGHYTEWLQYGYYQQGRAHAARALLTGCAAGIDAARQWQAAHPDESKRLYPKPEAVDARWRGSLATMQATAIVEDPPYAQTAAALPVGREGRGREVGWDDFAQGWAALDRGDAAAAQSRVDALHALAMQPGDDTDSASTEAYLLVMARMLEARQEQARGGWTSGIELAQAAAGSYDALPFDFGPPVPVKPPHELAGDLLLAARRSGEAVVEYDQALKAAPRRAMSLLGRARALQAAGDAARVHEAYVTLAAIWKNADDDLPARAEAVAGTAPTAATR